MFTVMVVGSRPVGDCDEVVVELEGLEALGRLAWSRPSCPILERWVSGCLVAFGFVVGGEGCWTDGEGVACW